MYHCIANIRIFVIFVVALTTLSAKTTAGEDLKCTKLQAAGTTVKCLHGGKDVDCSKKESEPKTKATYNCKGKHGESFSGTLDCTFGVWNSILHLGNSSLCNLGGKILNIVYPDFLRTQGILKFTVPDVPKNASLPEEENLALELHNQFRAKHQIPPLRIDQKYNEAALKVVNKLVKNISPDADAEESAKNLGGVLAGVSNMETNIYRRHPANSSSIIDLVGQAVVSWYTIGARMYNFNNTANNLVNTNALMFARMVWKSTDTMGVATGLINDTAYVVCVYTPGRNVVTTDIISDFQKNVIPSKN